MIRRAFLILRNILIVVLALAMGIALHEMAVNVPKEIKIIMIASVVLTFAHNHFALEYYKFIHHWLRKKLIRYESVTYMTVARQMVSKKVSFLGLVLCRGSTFYTSLVSLAETAAKLINFKMKVNTQMKIFSMG